jgi:hypothetical protein
MSQVRVEKEDKKPWWQSEQGSLLDIQRRRQQEGITKAPTQERPQLWGFPAVGQFLKERGEGASRDVLNTADFLGSLFTGQRPAVGAGDIAFPRYVNPQQPVPQADPSRKVLAPGERIPSPSVPFQPLPITPMEGFIETYGGEFDETPYRNYMNFLATQDEETMARINAMYQQLADSAGANMQRVADVYDSARIQSGDVFGGSAQNIEDAYGSASQQAADQMQRLGIEAAAPAVLDPMALSQAEAVSGIERAGAGALDALTRYGTSAQDFGGQMAQVGQQQGLEVSNQILRDMAQRQAEAAFQMEQARSNFNPYTNAFQRLEFENAWNQPTLKAEEAERQRAFDMAKLEIERRMQFDEGLRRDVQRYMDQGLEYDDAVEAVLNLTGYNPYG